MAPEEDDARVAGLLLPAHEPGEVGRVIVGQKNVIRHVLTGILSGGHVLLEGVPGLGKTMLIRTLADVLDLKFSRIQFTPDLMPADIVGTDILEETEDGHREFRFHDHSRAPYRARRD